MELLWSMFVIFTMLYSSAACQFLEIFFGWFVMIPRLMQYWDMLFFFVCSLQFQLELFLILNLQRIGLLDEIAWWRHTLTEGSAGSSSQQTGGYIAGRGLTQGRVTQILQEGTFINDLGTWKLKKKIKLVTEFCDKKWADNSQIRNARHDIDAQYESAPLSLMQFWKMFHILRYYSMDLPPGVVE